LTTEFTSSGVTYHAEPIHDGVVTFWINKSEMLRMFHLDPDGTVTLQAFINGESFKEFKDEEFRSNPFYTLPVEKMIDLQPRFIPLLSAGLDTALGLAQVSGHQCLAIIRNFRKAVDAL
jgi:hypothetical protein